MFNWPKLEQEFNEAIAVLPNYKRENVIAYVAALRVVIKDKDDQISQLADQVIDLEARVEAQNGSLARLEAQSNGGLL